MFPSQVEEQILSLPALAGHYQIEVSRQGNLDELAIQVELRAGVDDAEPREISTELAHEIKPYIGVNARVDV